MNGLIDFHTHILPNMDDGPKTVEESIEMINELKNQGISTIVSTSHYYMQDENIETFLKRRQESFDTLKAYAKNNNIELPNIILGAEVLFSSLLCDIDCRPLCIGNTSNILIEMPYRKFSQRNFKSLENFINMSGLQCILAHIERYYYFNDEKDIINLASQDVLCQVNAGSIVDRKSRKRTLKLIKNGYAHILGSDTHNMDSRKPRIGECVEILSKKKYAALFDEMNNTAKSLLKL